ncbi:molybdate ABC transporter substrate-binding protein [Campylobacter ureolyticus]|uniref:molybdate ABC transporter substrate-binding protein n=1 Tax=Campylobacter ureolyticus TaxID=827 RepID=UPI0026EC5D5B|nr:molybdate ABC transporter substrate-binding protein [Campylobacter ureolyticus]
MKKFLALAFSICILSAAEIKIAAAANIGYVFEELKTEFLKDRKGDNVVADLGSSGQLSVKIQAGADYAIFMAANMKFANDLNEKGFSASGQAVPYTRGVLVAFSDKKRDLSDVMNLLKDKSIEKISVGNTKTAPYGIAAKEAFKNAGIYNDIEKKLVYAQSISGVMPHVISGAADIGFIPKSGLVGKDKYKKDENFVEVDRALYTPLDQGMILLKGHENDKLAKEFFKFIQSDRAKAIFAEFGYE